MPTRRPAFAAALLLGAAGLATAQAWTLAGVVGGAGEVHARAPGPSTASPEAAAAPAARARRPVIELTAPRPPISPATPISLSVRDADLVEVVRSLVRIAGLNLVVDPSVRGTVTAELHDVPWDRALAVILRTNGLGMELDGRVVTVAPPARLYSVP